MKTKHGTVLTPTDLWFRVGVGAFLIAVGFLTQAGAFSVVLILLGAAWIGWAVFRGIRQVKRAERIASERRARGA